jgi:hypothetical protein
MSEETVNDTSLNRSNPTFSAMDTDNTRTNPPSLSNLNNKDLQEKSTVNEVHQFPGLKLKKKPKVSAASDP